MTYLIPITRGLLVLAFIILAGCGSGQDRNAATTKASAAVPTDVHKSKQELDLVVASLKNLRDAGDTADLKMLYGDLKTNRGQWSDALKDVLSSSEVAVTTGKDQINRWHAQADTFSDPDLRNSSSRREGDLRTAVDELSKSRRNLVAASDEFNAQLNQVLQALDLDLSKSGASYIKPVLSRVIDKEGNERIALTDVSEKSDAVNAQTTW